MKKRLLSILLGAGTMRTSHGIGYLVDTEHAPNRQK